MKKLSLTEATVKALEGKLIEDDLKDLISKRNNIRKRPEETIADRLLAKTNGFKKDGQGHPSAYANIGFSDDSPSIFKMYNNEDVVLIVDNYEEYSSDALIACLINDIAYTENGGTAYQCNLIIPYDEYEELDVDYVANIVNKLDDMISNGLNGDKLKAKLIDLGFDVFEY